MKKKLEADLMSIAHRVLQIKNKSDINQLCIETQKLYEKLSILRFVEEHFEGAKPNIGQAEVVAKMKQFFEENHLTEVRPASTKLQTAIDIPVDVEISAIKIIETEIAHLETDNKEIREQSTNLEFISSQDQVGSIEDSNFIEDDEIIPDQSEFTTNYDLEPSVQPVIESNKKSASIQISFEELLGADYMQTHFVRVDQAQSNPLDFELPKSVPVQIESEELAADVIINSIYDLPINPPTIERFATGISIGLNDRIAFIKHLFGNSDEDYNRVLNQLITFDSFEEAKNFIDDMVKPDYNDWQGKEDYEQRFIEIVEKKFA